MSFFFLWKLAPIYWIFVCRGPLCANHALHRSWILPPVCLFSFGSADVFPRRWFDERATRRSPFTPFKSISPFPRLQPTPSDGGQPKWPLPSVRHKVSTQPTHTHTKSDHLSLTHFRSNDPDRSPTQWQRGAWPVPAGGTFCDTLASNSWTRFVCFTCKRSETSASCAKKSVWIFGTILVTYSTASRSDLVKYSQLKVNFKWNQCQIVEFCTFTHNGHI